MMAQDDNKVEIKRWGKNYSNRRPFVLGNFCLNQTFWKVTFNID